MYSLNERASSQERDSMQAHISTPLTEPEQASSPPSSSPVIVTPHTESVGADETGCNSTLPSGLSRQRLCPSQYSLMKSSSIGSNQFGLQSTCASEEDEDLNVNLGEMLDLCTGAGQASFSRQLDILLRAVQQDRSSRGISPSSRSLDWEASLDSNNASETRSLTTDLHAHGPSSSSAKRTRSHLAADTAVSPLALSRSEGSRKKRKTQGPYMGNTRNVNGNYGDNTSTQSPAGTYMSEAHRLRYAKGAGSLRRAASLRSDVKEHSASQSLVHSPSNPKPSKTSPLVSGAIVDGYAPTVPTTPTTGGVDNKTKEDALANIPIIAPPPFEYIPRAPLSAEEAAEWRISRLLEKELDERTADGLQARKLDSPPHSRRERPDDEEEQFWLDDDNERPEEIDVERWLAEEEARECCYRPKASRKGRSTPASSTQAPPRAAMSNCHIDLGLKRPTLEEVNRWFLEAMPTDEYETSYTPGDLYDILSTSNEVRFHAAHLFARYFFLVELPATPWPESQAGEREEAAEAIVWDIAAACLAISIKFHRDVLYPLDVIYAHEYMDLAQHELAFEDFEQAQRDILEAIAFRIGSATPGAYMAELWNALPSLRRLLSFDGAWAGAQERAWGVLCDALEREGAEVLRYPASLLTAGALMQGILEVLMCKYKASGVDGRGRTLKKRDTKSLKKAATKASRYVRLDIQDVMRISDDELLKCREWLGINEG